MVVARALVLGSFLFLFASCTTPEAEDGGRKSGAPRGTPREVVIAPRPIAAPPAASAGKRVILVTLDGTRWQDVAASDGDLFPRVSDAVAEGGVVVGGSTLAGCGVVRATSGSNVSLPGYLEIMTARATACTHNQCRPPSAPTILDLAADRGVRLVASIASWEILGRAVTAPAYDARVLVSAGSGAWPDERPLTDARLDELVSAGERADPFPAAGGKYRPDRHTGAIAVAYYRAHRPRLLHVGLGDMDEHAHRADQAAYFDALRDADAIVGELVDAVEEAGFSGSTTFVITSDHGRGPNFRDHGPGIPQSARSFVVAFGGGVRPGGVACARRDATLADVGATVAALLDLPLDGAPGAGRPIEEIVER